MKKPISVLLSLAITLSSTAFIPLSASAATVVETMPYETFSSSNAASYTLYNNAAGDGVWFDTAVASFDGEAMRVSAGRWSETTGPAITFNRLSPDYAKYGFYNGGNGSYFFSEAWKGYNHVFKTRVSVSQIGQDGAFTSIVGASSSSSDTLNSYSSNTNYMQLEKNSGTDTLTLKINLSEKGVNPPSSIIDGYDSVAVGQWIDICLLFTGDNSNTVTYFVDGKNVGTTTFTISTPRMNSMMRFRTYCPSVSTSAEGIIAQFDDMALTSVSKSDGAIPFDVTSASAENGTATIHFATEIYDTIKSAVTINGKAVSADRVTILPDQKSVSVDGVDSTDFYLGIKDGTTDVYGTAANGISYRITDGEKFFSGKADWVAYEDFSDFNRTGWYVRGQRVTLKDDSTTVTVDDDKTLRVASTADSGMDGMSKWAEDFGADKFLSDADADYKMVVKAKMSVKEHTRAADTTHAAAEVSFAKETSTQKKLFRLIPVTAESSTAFDIQVNGDYVVADAGQIGLNEWVDFTAVGNISNGQERWTYYVNGEKVTKADGSDEFVSDNVLYSTGVNSIQFASRGIAQAGFDNIAAYIISNPEKDLTVYKTTDPVTDGDSYSVDYAVVNSSDTAKTVNVYFAEYTLTSGQKQLSAVKTLSREVPANGIAPFEDTYTKTGGIETEVNIYMWDENMTPLIDTVQDSGLSVAEADVNPFEVAQRMLTASSAEKTTFSDDGCVTIINNVTSEAKATAAAYICGGSSNKDTNFSGQEVIIVKNDPDSWGTARKGYLGFDISSVSYPAVSSAFVRLYCTSMQDNIPHYAGIYECTGEWEEDTITWNNAPAAGKLLSKTYIPTAEKTYYFDVTDYVNSCLAQGKNPSFVLQDEYVSDIGSGLRTDFSSVTGVKEPKLILIDEEDGISPAKDDPAEYNQTVQAQRWTGDSYRDYLSRDLSSLTDFSPSTENAQLSKYGGDLTKSYEATGAFYVTKQDGRWHIVDPDGYEYYNLGVASVEPGSSAAETAGRESVYDTLYDWAEGTTSMLRDDFGFNGVGGWSDLSYLPGVSQQPLNTTEIAYFLKSYMRSLGLDNSTGGNTTFANNNTLNVFDPAFETYCDKRAQALSDKYTYKSQTNFIGWMSDNELPDDIKLLDRYLALDPSDSRNLYSYVTAWEWFYSYTGKKNPSLSEITDVMREDFREFVYDRYFYVVSSAIKKYAPDKLFLGARHASGESSGIMKAAGRYCDIVSINYYGVWTPDSGLMAQWSSWTGRPFIITEWYAMAYDSGLACTTGAGFRVNTQEERGTFYQNYALKLLQTKNCVGFHWFKYLDNDPNATDRDASNIDGNKGILNINFQPYTDLTDSMREININVYKLIDYFDGR